MSTFIETQFPIARLSAESYKERKANNGQTLTRLGKWWGRKPLILARAAVVGMLMPASDNPKKDRQIFLKILTMDDDGAWQRCKGQIPVAAWRDAAPEEIREEYFSARGFNRGMTKEEKDQVCAQIWEALSPQQQRALDAQRKRPFNSRFEFDALPYSERIDYCDRPENITGPPPEAWVEINRHLGTRATCLAGLIEELGQRVFGHTPRVGDCFCGGGSIPFEAARIGCSAFGSDLNPVAGMLTWASLNLLGGGPEAQKKVMHVQEETFAAADRQITEWGIEHNDQGERADALLYCVEVKPEGCEYYIPLAGTWLLGEKSRVVASWKRENRVRTGCHHKYLSFHSQNWPNTRTGKVPRPSMAASSILLILTALGQSRPCVALMAYVNGPMRMFRHVLRMFFRERLYCIRWIDSDGKKRYAAPGPADLAREQKVLRLLNERRTTWQSHGYIPSKAIPENGDKTDKPIRTRGWTHWHHLFNARQLLTNGLLAEIAAGIANTKETWLGCLLGLGRVVNWNSKLCGWDPSAANEKGNQVFQNQALNPIVSYSVRPFPKLITSWPVFDEIIVAQAAPSEVITTDARDLQERCDFWITDPPYADAINYHELGDFFLAWYDKQLQSVFPEWIPDARAELAVRGDGEDFRRSMVEIYKNLARLMPDNGMQLVMFTHQDPSVWADLGMILWAAGLEATAAWTISTETDVGGLKKGNYVQGTVCLILRKRINNEPGFLDEVYPLVEDEVKRQIASMQALDEGGEPNFNDADYQLAAYAAALKVLTQYGNLDGRDVEHEVFAVRGRNEKSDFQVVIERALGMPATRLSPRALIIHGAILRWLSAITSAHSTLRAGESGARACMRNWRGVLASLKSGHC